MIYRNDSFDLQEILPIDVLCSDNIGFRTDNSALMYLRALPPSAHVAALVLLLWLVDNESQHDDQSK
jgi:hypothetical protein